MAREAFQSIFFVRSLRESFKIRAGFYEAIVAVMVWKGAALYGVALYVLALFLKN